MREKQTIDLKVPLETHEGKLYKIVLREPTFDEYLAYGDPYSIAYTADGTPFAIEDMATIRRYITACVVEPKDPALLIQASAIVARDVKNKLLGFFQPGERTVTASETSGTTSPSPGSDQTPSSPSSS
jgi:hypothetical protein